MKMPNSKGKNTGNNVAKTLKNATKNTMKSQSIHVEICAYVAIKSYGRGTQQGRTSFHLGNPKAHQEYGDR